MEVTVGQFKPTTKEGNLKTWVNIIIGGVQINECKIIQQPGQRAFVAMPDREYQQPDGKKAYYPIVKLTDELKDKVRDVVIPAWEEFCGKVKFKDPAGITNDRLF